MKFSTIHFGGKKPLFLEGHPLNLILGLLLGSVGTGASFTEYWPSSTTEGLPPEAAVSPWKKQWRYAKKCHSTYVVITRNSAYLYTNHMNIHLYNYMYIVKYTCAGDGRSATISMYNDMYREYTVYRLQITCRCGIIHWLICTYIIDYNRIQHSMYINVSCRHDKSKRVYERCRNQAIHWSG